MKKIFIDIALIISIALGWTQDSRAAYVETLHTIIHDPSDVVGALSNEGNIIHVPGDVQDLQDAMNQVIDEGIIELSGGIYNSPNGGFLISNLNKGFTIRAADGETVNLDGEGSREILRLMNSDVSQGGSITFQDIVFSNGYSNIQGIAGGVTLHNAEATFIDCTFQNNSAGPTGVAGGTLVTLNSTAFFFNSYWFSNTAVNFGGGLAVEDFSRVYIHNSQFINNQTNLPNHALTASGGGIHVGNSLLRVSNSRFENNQAGYVGGGLYAIGNWKDPITIPSSDIIISNCTFMKNKAVRDPSVSNGSPTEGGAIHSEAQTTMKIFNSRFTANYAGAGGAISSYQSINEIKGSEFLGNYTQGSETYGGYGGAISAGSNDVPAYGDINRRPVNVTIRNSYIQGGFNNVYTVGYGGGGIYVNGDLASMYGSGGVTQKGTAEDNRAKLTINQVVFNDLNVEKPPDDGMGGAIFVDLVDLSIENSLVIDSEAIGTNYGSGGGIAIINNSLANVENTTIANNTSTSYGGGIFVHGSTVNINNSTLFQNEISPGIAEDEYISYGAAIFSSSDPPHDLPADGYISNNWLVKNTGLSIFDDDRSNGPINDVVYNNNSFFESTFGVDVYRDALIAPQSVSGLNSLIVTRSGGNPSTDKSLIDNQEMPSDPVITKIMAAPSIILPTTAAGDPDQTTTAYIAYAWNGTGATLNGVPLSDQTGMQATGESGEYTLSVDGYNTSAQVSMGATPTVLVKITPGDPDSTLNWDVTGGTFLDAAMDQGMSIPSTPNGSVQIPNGDKTYWFYAITEEGGVLETVNTNTDGPFLFFLPLVIKE